MRGWAGCRFAALFVRSIAESPQAHSVEQRLTLLNEYLLKLLFHSACWALFEKHKLAFAFHLALQLQVPHHALLPHTTVRVFRVI